MRIAAFRVLVLETSVAYVLLLINMTISFFRLCAGMILVLRVSLGTCAGLPKHYTNPIGGAITMGHPFILADAGHFYLYRTTAVNQGFKCWSSTNWIDWPERGLAFRKGAASWGGKTLWAPEVIKYRDRYYMAFSCEPATNKSFSTRICLAVSRRPEGPFEEFRAPLFDNGWSCSEAHIFVDADATPYLFFDKVGAVGQPPKRYLSGIIHGVKLKPDLSGIEGNLDAFAWIGGQSASFWTAALLCRFSTALQELKHAQRSPVHPGVVGDPLPS